MAEGDRFVAVEDSAKLRGTAGLRPAPERGLDMVRGGAVEDAGFVAGASEAPGIE
jgi:hypothetical protein